MTKVVPYLTFDAVVGKNSAFNDLSDEELEELGGVELRALNLLSWAVPAYWFGVQLLGFTIIAPYMARAQFRDGLTTEDGQAAAVNSTWLVPLPQSLCPLRINLSCSGSHCFK